MDWINNVPVLKSFLVGSVSGTCSTILFQPLDLVKTRLQNPPHPGVSPGVFAVVGNVLRHENVFALWKGMTPSMARCIPGVGVYFGSLEYLITKFTNGDPSPVEAVCLGLVARSFSGISLLPFTVIKTRFESGLYKYGGVIEALKSIYATEGARGLYSGLSATLLRDAPFSGIYLMFYTQLKKKIPEGSREGSFSSVWFFSCGVVSGCLASFVTQPADVIKTRMQLYPKQFSKISIAIVHIYQSQGVVGYFRGLAPRMLRRTLMSAMSWTLYEQIMKHLGLK